MTWEKCLSGMNTNTFSMASFLYFRSVTLLLSRKVMCPLKNVVKLYWPFQGGCFLVWPFQGGTFTTVNYNMML